MWLVDAPPPPHKEVLLIGGHDHDGVGWPINIGVVLVELWLAKHQFQTFHGTVHEMVMRAMCKMCVHVRSLPLESLTKRGCGRGDGECLIEWGRC